MKILKTLLLLFILFLFVSCGNSSQDNSTAQENNETIVEDSVETSNDSTAQENNETIVEDSVETSNDSTAQENNETIVEDSVETSNDSITHENNKTITDGFPNGVPMELNKQYMLDEADSIQKVSNEIIIRVIFNSNTDEISYKLINGQAHIVNTQ